MGEFIEFLLNSLFVSPNIKPKQVRMAILFSYIFRYTCLKCGPNGSQTVVNVCVQRSVAKYELE